MKLIILSGSSCSGKTTFIKNNYENFEVISSDKEIFLIKKNTSESNHIKLYKLGLKEVYKKIEKNIKNNINTIYDGTNLDISKRKDILYICKKIEKNRKIEIIGINMLNDFNIIYKNWIKRGKDIKIENLLFLYSIHRKIKVNEGFNKIKNIKIKEENNFKYLKLFLKTGKYDELKLLEENKDLKILNIFWKKAGKNYFKEYYHKVGYLDELSLEDKLALLYSDIKYFYKDFISNVKMVYMISYEDFINQFYKNIIVNKIDIMGLNGEKTYNSLIKLIDIF